MSSFLERKSSGPAKLAQTAVLGEKFAMNRCREEHLWDANVLIVDDDPVMHVGRKALYGMPCGGRRRACSETGIRAAPRGGMGG